LYCKTALSGKTHASKAKLRTDNNALVMNFYKLTKGKDSKGYNITFAATLNNPVGFFLKHLKTFDHSSRTERNLFHFNNRFPS